jgi:hypothetical protein
MFENVKDYIHVEKGVIPRNICDFTIDDLEKRDWRAHTWYNPEEEGFNSEETMELEVQFATPDLRELLMPHVFQAAGAYNAKFAFSNEKTDQIFFKFSHIRFNRYSPGQIMRVHHDHIHSLFDGNNKGIPVISFVGNLNDNYEGADIFFWDDYVVELGAGDILMFPSLFMYPHGVTEATKGRRYSFVSWAW